MTNTPSAVSNEELRKAVVEWKNWMDNSRDSRSTQDLLLYGAALKIEAEDTPDPRVEKVRTILAELTGPIDGRAIANPAAVAQTVVAALDEAAK